MYSNVKIKMFRGYTPGPPLTGERGEAGRECRTGRKREREGIGEERREKREEGRGRRGEREKRVRGFGPTILKSWMCQ
jgi:hypothetical protein